MTHTLFTRFRSLCCLLMATLGLLFSAPAAAQDTLVAGTWYTVGINGAGTPLVRCSGCSPSNNPTSIDVPTAPWIITVAAGQQLHVVDAWTSSDQFELFINGVSLGTTSAPTVGGSCLGDLGCAMADPRYSQGTFTLPAGTHTLTGRQVAGTGGAAYFTVTSTAVPGVAPTLSGAMAQGQVAQAYSFTPTLGPVNVQLPVTFSALGALPPGMALNTSTGEVSGTPTQAGTFSFSLRASNAAGTSDLALTWVVVAPAPAAPSLSGSTGNGVVGQAYSFTPTVGPANVQLPITFSVLGALPPGMALNTSTGELSGTPTQAGTFSFSLQASNAVGTSTLALTWVVTAAVAVPTLQAWGLIALSLLAAGLGRQRLRAHRRAA